MKILVQNSENKITLRVKEFAQDVVSTIKSFFRAVKRSYDFAKIGWSNYDWDYNYLLELMSFKLKRIEKAILNGNAELDKTTVQSIRICIKLLKKLSFEDYHYFTNIHYEKWGFPNWEYGETDSNGLSSVQIIHKNIKTEADKDQARKELVEAYQKDLAQEQRDSRLLFAIMAKYHKTWWD